MFVFFQEHEILNAWLTDLGFEEYYDLFVQSGYDMHTITRMTPEVGVHCCVHWPGELLLLLFVVGHRFLSSRPRFTALSVLGRRELALGWVGGGAWSGLFAGLSSSFLY